MPRLLSMSPHVRLALLCAALLALSIGPAAAQTPAATIEDDGGTVVLESYVDGALLAPGTFGTGTIPTTGSGTRLMWYPAKGAFRAGRVGRYTDGTEWNATNVGDYSLAVGLDTEASDEAAMALGRGTTASGYVSTTMGSATTASAAQATAMGFQTTASNNQATAMGNNTTASAIASTAMGNRTVAATENSLTVGTYNDRNRGNDDSDPTTGPLFVVGNGSSGSRNDALVLEQSGNLIISSTSTFSDRRLKTAVTPLGSEILGKLDAIRPVRYKFKDQDTRPSGEQIGLMAQDVQKEFPELVSGEDDEYLSLSYSKFTAVLLKGLQEQQAHIERQNTRIDQQQATINSLEQRVRKIEDVQSRLAQLEAQVQDRSLLAGVPGSTAFGFGLLLGGLLGAGLLWRRRS